MDEFRRAAFRRDFATLLGHIRAEAIRHAAARLEPDDDDIAHADDYPIPPPEARTAARELASRIVRACVSNRRPAKLAAAMPRLGASGSGGVALHWRTDRIELLISVPRETGKGIPYYGETRSGATIEGSLSLDGPVGFLAQWLIENELSG